MATTASPLHAGLAGRTADIGRPRADRVPGWLRALVRVPLLGKLVGANALIVIAATALFLVHHAGAGEGRMAGVMIAALMVSLLVNLLLVYVALRPVRDLEAAAARVAGGDLDARVAPSVVADAQMERVAGTFNALLDRLMADRARVRQLAAQVIAAGEKERGRIARELHDSTAQTLAALALQAGTAIRNDRDPNLVAQLDLIRDLAVQALEEVRTLSQTVRSSVLDNLGLPAALERITRQTREQTGVNATVRASAGTAAVPRSVASVLYFVAQEATRNAVRHADPRHVVITLIAEEGLARLEVADDGRGFDPEAPKGLPVDARSPAPTSGPAPVSGYQPPGRQAAEGGGLFSMRERVALVDGAFYVDSGPGRGTRVVAAVPIWPSACSQAATADRAPTERQS